MTLEQLFFYAQTNEETEYFSQTITEKYNIYNNQC